ncbi:MAG: bacteriohemerythrin [Patescibacteria group bacterium]|nr:bacteriohemerythrin [Patescibacteria group bacterium]
MEVFLDFLSVNVEEIDKQHKMFLSILNSLYVVLKKDESEKEISNILKQLISYTNFHFATEERYFDKFNYSLAEEHKKQHNDLKLKVEEFKKRFDLEGAEILFDLIDFLEDWHVEHLSMHDKKYVECFNKNGLT